MTSWRSQLYRKPRTRCEIFTSPPLASQNLGPHIGALKYCGLLGNTEESTLPDTFSWLHGEASIDDFLADPIVQLLMQSDRVSEGELRALLRTASEKLTRAPE